MGGMGVTAIVVGGSGYQVFMARAQERRKVIPSQLG
jgi:hypothetical protein